MKRIILRTATALLPACCLMLVGIGVVRAQAIWAHDDFMHANAKLHWIRSTGTWEFDSGSVSIRTGAYDQLLAWSYYIFGVQPYSIEVTLRGTRAGIYFSLDDTGSKALSQMVRFDGNSILAGHFNGAGEYTSTNTFNLKKSPIDWTTLRIDVYPKQRRYEVFVDGTSVGADENLVFPSGYVGLEASDGSCAFKSINVYGKSRVKIPSKPRIGRRTGFQHVRYVETEGKNVSIYNPELKLWQTLNPDGKVIKQNPAKQAPPERTEVTYDKRTYSIREDRIIVTDAKGISVDSLVRQLVHPTSLLIDSREKAPLLDVADQGANAIFQFTLDGRLLTTIDGSLIGGFKAPRGLDLYGKKGLVVADYDKLVLYDPDIDTRTVDVTPLSPTEVEIKWYSSALLRTFVSFAPDGGRFKTLNRVSVEPSGLRYAVLRNLEPMTRYSFRVSPTFNTIPEDLTDSKIFRFVTPPKDSSMMEITRLPVMCMVYRAISYRDRYPKDKHPEIPDGRRITDQELQYLKQATEFNRDFYFRNSGCKLVLDFDFYVVEDTLWLHDVADTDPYWLSPNDRVTKDFEGAARHFGKNPEFYAGLVCPYAWLNYPTRLKSALTDPSKSDSINIRQAVGGGTNGVPAPWKYGKTTGYTANPFPDAFSRQDWLITHEFNHQVDALMDASGFPEYYHADMPWKMPGRFGEDFDFNAHILRNAPPNSWLALKFGSLSQTKDEDHDGVPDDDTTLPFDEKRLNGNPHSKDSDGDGLNDLQEVLTGSIRGTELNNKDTDGDGLNDSIDPEPLYPTNPIVKKLISTEDLQKTPFAILKTAGLQATTYVRWDDHFLYISVTTDKPANILIQIDANNDGWFHGFDNVQIRLMNNGDSVWVADYYLRDCSSWRNPPKDRRDILKNSDLRISSATDTIRSGGKNVAHTVTVRIPRNDPYGLRLEPGKQMSIRLGLQTKTDLWVWDEFFERNYMMPITLQ